MKQNIHILLHACSVTDYSYSWAGWGSWNHFTSKTNQLTDFGSWLLPLPNAFLDPRNRTLVAISNKLLICGFFILTLNRLFKLIKDWWYNISQMSSLKSTTQLSRFWMEHQRTTVILHRWISIDCRYWLYSQVGESLSTVYIDRGRLTRLINQWIGIDI